MTNAVFHIMLALKAAPRHGYEIMRWIDENTDGQVRIGPGTLYRSIASMLDDGIIAEFDERADRRRRPYRLTRAGRRALTGEVGRLEKQLELARGVGVSRVANPGAA